MLRLHDSNWPSPGVSTVFFFFFFGGGGGRLTTFFVEAIKLKVTLTDPPNSYGFVIGEASGDGQPMIDRQSADFLMKLISWYPPNIARSLGVNRSTTARWSVNDIFVYSNMTWFFSPIKSTDTNSALFSRYKHWQ